MKIQKLFLPFLILTIFFSGTLVQAQSKSEKEKAQQEKIMELEKRLEEALKMKEAELEKALKEQKRSQNEELKAIMENRQKVQEKAMEQYKKAWKSNEDEYYKQWNVVKDLYGDKRSDLKYYDRSVYDRGQFDKNYRVVVPEMDFVFEGDRHLGLSSTFLTSDKDRTALTIHKDLDDVTFDTKFKYDVTEGSSGINFKVEGGMDEGTLLIRIVKSDGKVLQEIEISPLADISWNQDLRWDTDEEKEDNIGSWIIVVSAKNASGQYSVNVRAH